MTKEFLKIMILSIHIGLAIIDATVLIAALFFPDILISTAGIKTAAWDPESYRWFIAAISAIATSIILYSAYRMNKYY